MSSSSTVRSNDMQQLYKNRLQTYFQKRHLPLPMYSEEVEGPPHALRFKSKVTIGDLSFETSEYFTKLKEAQNAAAKVALESMSLHETQDDEGMYKTRLQQIGQKEGLPFPTYNTVQSGKPHIPTFVSTVEIGGKYFRGNIVNTRRLAEASAAKVAYNFLMECEARKDSTVSAPGIGIKRDLEPSVTDDMQANSMENVESKSVLETNTTIDEQADDIKEADVNRKRQRNSSSPDGASSPSAPKRVFGESKTNMTIPDDATTLSNIDKSWLVLGQDGDNNQ